MSNAYQRQLNTEVTELAPRINLHSVRVGSLISATVNGSLAHGLVISVFPHGIECELAIFREGTGSSYRSKRILTPEHHIELISY